MESLAVFAAVVVACIAFLGSFAGFVIADNTDNTASLIFAALIPAIAIGFFTTVPALGVFWVLGYVLGYIFGLWMNSRRS